MKNIQFPSSNYQVLVFTKIMFIEFVDNAFAFSFQNARLTTFFIVDSIIVTEPREILTFSNFVIFHSPSCCELGLQQRPTPRLQSQMYLISNALQKLCFWTNFSLNIVRILNIFFKFRCQFIDEPFCKAIYCMK